MKICSKCKTPKDDTEFNKKKGTRDGLNSQCKVCTRAAISRCYYKRSEHYKKKCAERRMEIKVMIQNIKSSTPCKDCGNSYPYYKMDFDHLEDDKEFCIGGSYMTKGKRQILAEIQKCDVICALCHRERTHQRQLQRTLGDNGIMLRFERRE